MRFPRMVPAALLTLSLPLLAGRETARAEQTSFPPEARLRFEQGVELQEKGDYRQAIEAYEDAIRKGMADYPRVHLYKAKALLALQKYQSAIARYSEFIKRFSLEDSCRY